MRPLPPSDAEAQRLMDVADASVFDKVTEDLLGAFVRVASDLVGTPISGVSLVGEHQQFFKSIKGLTAGVVPRREAFCSHAIARPDEVMVVSDLAADPRFRDNPLVSGDPGLRFYAGAPLTGSRGLPVGTLCVMDSEPRTVTPVMMQRLQDLALGVSAALSLRQAAREVHRAARTDSLTGLSNRAAFEEALADAEPRNLGLLMIDLDGFKPINDTYGHAGGDRALVEVAQRLRQAVRASDLVARLGGDEFVVLLRNLEAVEFGLGLAARIHAALADTFVLNGSLVPLRASIGFAGSPWHADSTDTLMERADVALYEAKRAGRSTTRSADIMPPARAIGRLALEALLREAFAPGGTVPFHLVFQPIVDLRTGEFASVEALLRWQTDVGSSLSPADVLPVIERMGYMGAFDRWVLSEACRLIALGHPPFTISVNASASTFGMPGFDAQVAAILERHGIGGERLMIEMTEGSLSDASEAAAQANMQGLRRIGVSVALDDFGGGHSTLARVHGYPFASLKIDRSLVKDCARDPSGAALIEAVAGVARAISVPAVAEGVETEAQLVVVARAGVERAQGFLLSHPVPWDRLEEAQVISRRRTRAALMMADEIGPSP